MSHVSNAQIVATGCGCGGVMPLSLIHAQTGRPSRTVASAKAPDSFWVKQLR